MLSKLVAGVAALNILVLPFDKNGIAQRRTLSSSVRSFHRKLHAENGVSVNNLCQSLVDNLFPAIKIVKSLRKRRIENDTQIGTLYSALRKYGSYPFHSTRRVSTIPSSFLKPLKGSFVAKDKVKSRYSNCWTVICSVYSWERPYDIAWKRRNLNFCRKARCFPQHAMCFTDMEGVKAKPCEMSEEFMALSALDDVAAPGSNTTDNDTLTQQ